MIKNLWNSFPTAINRYLLKRGTTWNDLKRARNDLKGPTTSKKWPEATYNEQETTWNDLQRARKDLKWPAASKKRPETTYNEQETTWNDPQRVIYNLKRPKRTYNEQKKRSETTNNKQILRLFYNMGQSVLFSNMFSTQHLIEIARALLHGESWWK